MDDRWYGRPLVGAACLFFVMNAAGFFKGEHPRVGLHVLVWASISAALLIPKIWWTRTRIWIAFGCLAVETTVGIVSYGETKLVYFLAIFIFAGAVRLLLSRTTFPALAVLLVMALLYIWFGRDDPFTILSFVLLTAALYLSLRSRLQRNDMFELNKRHLEDLKIAYEQLEESSTAAMQVAVMEERTRIARDIHDAVGHSLTSLIVQIQALRYMVRNDPAQAERTLDGMLAEARQGLHDIRSSVHDLVDERPQSGTSALKALLSRMESTAAIRYTFSEDLNEEEVSHEVFGTLFRVLQEAITNAVRHAEATRLDVSLKKEAGSIALRVRDNGVLEPGHPINEGFGLKMMRTRLEEKGGSLQYSILPPHGFEIAAEIPVQQARRGDNAQGGEDGAG